MDARRAIEEELRDLAGSVMRGPGALNEPIPLDQQLRAVKRELGMRIRAYPKWITHPTNPMTMWDAKLEIIAMASVKLTLEELIEEQRRQLNLFDVPDNDSASSTGSKTTDDAEGQVG